LREHDAGAWMVSMTPPIDRQATFSGTKDVAPALAFDVARLEAYLEGRLPEFQRPLRVRQFKGGQSNPTYLLETPAHRYVLRRKPPGKLLPSAHAVDREFRVISALHAQSFPRGSKRSRHALLYHGIRGRTRGVGTASARCAAG
jgi:hypothetical protein